MKRKIDLIEAKPTNTKTVSYKKNPLKSEVIDQLKNLQTKYDALEIEYANSIKTIQKLEVNAKLIQKSSNVKATKEAQTYCDDILICCNECLFTATCEEELNHHMWTEADDPEESKFEKDFFCKICRKSCKTVGNIKKHMTKHHTNKVQAVS